MHWAGIAELGTVSSARFEAEKVDRVMRRSFDGLMSIMQAEFKRDVRAGDLFVFINKRGDRLKALWWDSDGLAIFMKRLECGTYQRPLATDAKPHQHRLGQPRLSNGEWDVSQRSETSGIDCSDFLAPIPKYPSRLAVKLIQIMDAGPERP